LLFNGDMRLKNHAFARLVMVWWLSHVHRVKEQNMIRTAINLACKNNTTEFDECEIPKCIKIFLARG